MFFKILLSLGEWSNKIKLNLEKDEKFEEIGANIFGMSMTGICYLLEDFVAKRKNRILLQSVPISIQPEVLITKLNLDLRSIRAIFEFRVEAIK